MKQVLDRDACDRLSRYVWGGEPLTIEVDEDQGTIVFDNSNRETSITVKDDEIR